MSNLKLRALKLDEQDRAEHIMRAAIKGSCEKFYGQHTVKKWVAKENTKFKFQVPEHTFCVADDGVPVSIAGWTSSPTQNGDVNPDGSARISAVFTHPDYAGNGMGRELVNLIEDDIRKAGYTYIILYATMNAVPFYRKLGFEDRADQLIEVADGHYISIKRMVKGIAMQAAE